MGFLSWVIVGGVAGWLAGLVMKGQGFGIIGNIVVGAIGALVGGWLAGRFMDIADPISGFNATTLIVAFAGAVIVLFLARLLRLR
ncbi:MAG: GlsB/YeaQ/YmgE family stress response membrane protein [Bacillota bacterium]